MNTPAAADDAIHLSVVATSRNDDHGGFLTRRTQHFIDGLVAQCKRHGLRSELILVEWNPPSDRAPLSQELRWPSDPGPCRFRIVTVPPEVHRTIGSADSIRLFQMLAKNVGIRRASGKFILATNIDILFSDDIMVHLRDKLRSGVLYLADRVDVPSEVPATGDFEDVLRYCDTSAFRVNTGALAVERGGGRWRRRDQLKTALGARGGYVLDMVETYSALAGRTFANPRWAFRRVIGHGMAASGNRPRTSRARVPALLAGGAWEITRRVASGAAGSVRQLAMPFTNACGDFTLMSREDWTRVRGYAEWHVFSWHLDTLLVYQAIGCGIRVSRLPSKARVFHIDHGGGYAPEHAAELFGRLTARGVPFITDEQLRQLYTDISRKKRYSSEVQFNETGWGMAATPLTETRPTAT